MADAKQGTETYIVPIGATHTQSTVARGTAVGWVAITDDVGEEMAAIPRPVTFLTVFDHGIGSAKVVPRTKDVYGRGAMDRTPAGMSAMVGPSQPKFGQWP